MGESALHAKASVRLSLGRDTQADDIERAIAAAVQAIGPLLASRRSRPSQPVVGPCLLD